MIQHSEQDYDNDALIIQWPLLRMKLLTLRDNWEGSYPLSVDDIQMPASYQSELSYDFSGKDPNFPQLHAPKYQNVFLKQFVSVHRYVRSLTFAGNLASARSRVLTITQRESDHDAQPSGDRIHNSADNASALRTGRIVEAMQRTC